MSFSSSSTASGSLTVDYDYGVAAPGVPEPGTASLMGLSFAGIAAGLRKRRARG